MPVRPATASCRGSSASNDADSDICKPYSATPPCASDDAPRRSDTSTDDRCPSPSRPRLAGRRSGGSLAGPQLIDKLHGAGTDTDAHPTKPRPSDKEAVRGYRLLFRGQPARAQSSPRPRLRRHRPTATWHERAASRARQDSGHTHPCDAPTASPWRSSQPLPTAQAGR